MVDNKHTLIQLSNIEEPNIDAPMYLTLFIDVRIMYIRNIDCVDGSFECGFIMHTRWNSPGNASFSPNREEWEPSILFANAIGEVQVTQKILRKSETIDDVTKITLSMFVNGRFAQHYNFNKFPFDSQHLLIHMNFINCPQVKRTFDFDNTASNTPLWYSTRYMLRFGPIKMTQCSFMDRDSWELAGEIYGIISKTNPELHPQGLSFCKATTCLTIQRKPSHFFWYFAFPVSMQLLASFMTLFMEYDNLSGKTESNLNIMLTMFAVKFSSTQYVPSVACVTYMERYFVFNILATMLIMLQNLVVLLLYNSDPDGTLHIRFNWITGICMGCAFTAIQVVSWALLLNKKLRIAYIKAFDNKEDLSDIRISGEFSNRLQNNKSSL
jgi:hypothetical protein